jgi:hypothetical protein
MKALREAGIHVINSLDEIGIMMLEALGKA